MAWSLYAPAQISDFTAKRNHALQFEYMAVIALHFARRYPKKSLTTAWMEQIYDCLNRVKGDIIAELISPEDAKRFVMRLMPLFGRLEQLNGRHER